MVIRSLPFVTCVWGVLGSYLKPQLTFLLAICAHLKVLFIPEPFLFSGYVPLCVCACMYMAFFFLSFNLCLSCFECWNLGGVFFRKPSLANIHDHSLLLLLTHCLHFLPFCVCLPCARPRPWEMSLLAEPADGEHGFRW